MATASTPQHAFVAAPVPGTAIAHSATLTVAVSIGGFEGVVPFVGVQPNTANISAGWEIDCYRSTDAGASYETVATYSLSINRNPNVKDTKAVRLDGGYWLLELISAGSAAGTWSFSIGTMDVISAVQNA